VNELIFAISRAMSYVSGAVTLVAAGLVIWRARETGQSWLKLMAWGLTLSVVGLLMGVIWGILYPIVRGGVLDPLSRDPSAPMQIVNSGLLFFRQIFGAVTIVFILLGAVQAARQARPPSVDPGPDNTES
jgi:hypothetical protein